MDRTGRARLRVTDMLISSFDEHEVEAIVTALRYWRAHRGDGRVRRGDPQMTTAEIELLLAKLRGGSITSLPSDEFPPYFVR